MKIPFHSHDSCISLVSNKMIVRMQVRIVNL